MQEPQERKHELLVHCLWMATLDPDYAIWAAGQYEKNEPWLLENLQAKVRQEVRRAERGVSDGTAQRGQPA